jgi:hypothetical protein
LCLRDDARQLRAVKLLIAPIDHAGLDGRRGGRRPKLREPQEYAPHPVILLADEGRIRGGGAHRIG